MTTTMFSSPGEGSHPPGPWIRGKQDQETPEEGLPGPAMPRRAWACHLPGRTRQGEQALPWAKPSTPKLEHTEKPPPPPPADTTKAVSQDFREQLATKPAPQGSVQKGLPSSACME